MLVGGCVLRPEGTRQERANLIDAGKAYQKPAAPELPAADVGWRDVLRRAFLVNGDLEAAYFEWAAAVERIDQRAGWPNTNVGVGFSYMFSGGRMKSWDRTTVTAATDTMQNLSLPHKAAKAGRVALDEARAAGQRFLAAKFELQRKVLTAYLDLALMEEKVRIQRDNVELLKLLADSAATRVQAGGPQQDLLKAQIQHRLAENELANMESERSAMRAMLNGMLDRPADAPLELPKVLPEPRPVGVDDAKLIAAGALNNAELGALARQVEGRKEALALAKLAYWPDINPSAGFTGTVSQFAGAMVMLPTTVPQIEAMIRESRAMLRSGEAMARQAKAERGAAFVAALYAMRNAERQAALFRDVVLPKARQALASSRQAYAAGSVGFVEVVDSQRTLLEVRQMIAEAQISREKQLAVMEALAGVDVETLVTPATRPSTQVSGAVEIDHE